MTVFKNRMRCMCPGEVRRDDRLAPREMNAIVMQAACDLRVAGIAGAKRIECETDPVAA